MAVKSSVGGLMDTCSLQKVKSPPLEVPSILVNGCLGILSSRGVHLDIQSLVHVL